MRKILNKKQLDFEKPLKLFCIFVEKHSHLFSKSILIYFQNLFSFIFKIYSHLSHFIFHFNENNSQQK